METMTVCFSAGAVSPPGTPTVVGPGEAPALSSDLGPGARSHLFILVHNADRLHCFTQQTAAALCRHTHTAWYLLRLSLSVRVWFDYSIYFCLIVPLKVIFETVDQKPATEPSCVLFICSLVFVCICFCLSSWVSFKHRVTLCCLLIQDVYRHSCCC